MPKNFCASFGQIIDMAVRCLNLGGAQTNNQGRPNNGGTYTAQPVYPAQPAPGQPPAATPAPAPQPAYPQPNYPQQPAQPAPAPTHGGGNSQLAGRDYMILIDQSGSMAYADIYPPGSSQPQTRWRAASEGVMALAHKVLQFDPDGILLYTYSNHFHKEHISTTQRVQQLFMENEPLLGTNLCGALNDSIEEYFRARDAGKQIKGATIIVVTDGAPNNPEGVIRILVNAANRCRNGEELAVSFIQLGQDHQATQFLNYLDNSLAQRGARNDIVDTKPWSYVEQNGFTAVLLQAIHD